MEEDSDTPDETPMLDDDSSNGHPSLHCDEWDQKVNARVSRSYLDRLVMNYLVIEGYKEVAECFQKESSISPTVDLRTIESRMDVRAAVMEGDMQRAIAQLNQHDPQVLQRHRGLYFTLQLQHLVELIRADRVNDALSFARTELAALGEESKENLRRLEEAMTLLLFRDKSKCPLSGLLDMAHRSRAADQANAAMLNSVSQTTEPVLPRLVRLLVHSQRELKRKAEFPAVPWFDD